MASTGQFVTDDPKDIARATLTAFGRHRSRGTFIVAIGGGAASGKSYLASTLQVMLEQVLGREAVAVLKLDYFLGRGLGLEPGANWEGYNWNEFAAVVRNVRQGRGSHVRIVEWESGETVDERLFPAGLRILLVDGVGIFQDRLDHYYHLGFWVDCPPQERLRRGIRRSYATPRPGGGNYGPEHEQMWPVWAHKDRLYMERHQPQHRPIVAGILKNDRQLPTELLRPM